MHTQSRSRLAHAAALLGALVLVALSPLATDSTSAAELAGVTLPDRVDAGGDNLVLNGLGLRKKAIFKVYVGGLYLKAKNGDAKAILAEDSARRMVLQFVRSVDKGALAGAWEECLQANAPSASAEVKKGFSDLGAWMEDVEDGDQLVFTYTPGGGTQVAVRGREKGMVAGKDYADALFSCWIGPHPPGEDFKQGLLGH